MANKSIIFRNLRNHSAFSPCKPDPMHQNVYVKKENGICPVVSRDNKWVRIEGIGVTYEQQGIFHPFDKVYPINVPPAILYHYR